MPPEPLKLYVNEALIAPDLSFVPILYPFWGLRANKENNVYLGAALKHAFDPAYFKLVDVPQEADYILVPHEYWLLKLVHAGLLQQMVEEAKRCDKPLLIDASGDVAGVVSVPYDKVKVLRINQYRFELPDYEIKVPVPCEDLLESYCGNALQPREKGEVAVVGFVGWGTMPLKQRLRSFTKEIPLRIRALFDANQRAKIKGVFWRERANKIFRASRYVQTNFIVRSSYSGYTQTLVGDKEKNRREFVDNILDSDYTLVIKGDANEATRFYEVLSLGRIPILIDTAVVLPLEEKINYREFCVFIDYKDLNRAPDILAEFHAKLSNAQFVEMQRKARYAFEHYLRYDAFSQYLVAMLK